jgi:1,2-phenylacetyl-CoA epoxidase catalytic subunit
MGRLGMAGSVLKIIYANNFDSWINKAPVLAEKSTVAKLNSDFTGFKYKLYIYIYIYIILSNYKP